MDTQDKAIYAHINRNLSKGSDTGMRFWDIFKGQPHQGLCGTMGLILGLGLQTALFNGHRSRRVDGAALRACFRPFLLPGPGPHRPKPSRPGLGQNAVQGSTAFRPDPGRITTLIPALALSHRATCGRKPRPGRHPPGRSDGAGAQAQWRERRFSGIRHRLRKSTPFCP